MADKTINQLTQATDLTDGSLFVIEQNSTAKQANWGMMKNYISPGVAAQYSTSAKYNVGDYVIYNDSLYRCNTAITTGEAWTAAHWTAAVLGNDVGELKSALKMNAELDGYSTVETDFHRGSFTTTGFNTDPTRCYMLIEQVGRGSKFIFDSSLVLANYFYVVSAADLTRLYTPNVWDNSGVLNLNYANNGTVVILLRDANDSSARISDHLSEVNARTQLYTYTRRAINWVAFGDSITHGSYSIAGGGTNNAPEYSYAYRIAKHLEPNKIGDFYNCGIRGLGWVKTGNNGETFADMLALYTGNKSNIELVTVMLGINDYISQENLGTIESSENDGTISGAIRSGLHTICTQYPGAKIFAISPLNSSYYGNVDNGWARNVRLNAPGSLQDVSDMIAYWADYFGVEYINELSESYITRYNINNFLLDHLHPSDEGQWMLARDIAQKIL